MPEESKDKSKKKKEKSEISVSLPREIRVVLVPLNDLRPYELFGWLLALFAPIAVGFWTAFFTYVPDDVNTASGAFFWSAFAFSLCSIIFLILAVRARKNLLQKGVVRKQDLDQFE